MKTIEAIEILAKTSHHNKQANEIITRTNLKDIFQLKKISKLRDFFPEKTDCYHTFSVDVDNMSLA